MSKAINKVVYVKKTLVDLTEDTVSPEHVLEGEILHLPSGKIVEGQMPNFGSEDVTITKRDDYIDIPKGYHDGYGHVEISGEERAKIVPQNIRMGVEILGVKGSNYKPIEPVEWYDGPYEVTPSLQETILATNNKMMDDDVCVHEIPVYRVSNPSGGTTVIISRED